MLIIHRLLELWQKRGSGPVGYSLMLQTSSGCPELDFPEAGNAALQAMVKVMAAEAPGIAFSGFNRDALAPHTADIYPQVITVSACDALWRAEDGSVLFGT